MKATLVERTEDAASVRVTPSWLARLFGARETIVDLDWHQEKGGRRGWLASGSRRWLDDIPYGQIIEDALDHAPVVPLPKAGARLRLVRDDDNDRKASE